MKIKRSVWREGCLNVSDSPASSRDWWLIFSQKNNQNKNREGSLPQWWRIEVRKQRKFVRFERRPYLFLLKKRIFQKLAKFVFFKLDRESKNILFSSAFEKLKPPAAS